MEHSNEELCALIQSGQREYLEELARRNQPFIANRARRLVHEELDDAIQNGYLGMLRAVESFDPEKGCSFLTYATYWIDQAIRRKQLLLSELSLDVPIVEDGEVSPVDLIVDENAVQPEMAAIKEDDLLLVRQAVADLPERERRLIEDQYYRELSVQQAGEAQGLTFNQARWHNQCAASRLAKDWRIREAADIIAYRHKPLSAFLSDWTSSVEAAVIRKEKAAGACPDKEQEVL